MIVNMEHVVIQLLVLGLPGVLYVKGIQDYKTWLKATETCQDQNKMLDPMDESIFPNLTHDLTMWTPDYVLNLGCEPKDSLKVVKFLHVKRIKEVRSHGICNNATTHRAHVCDRLDRGLMVNISGMVELAQVMHVMEPGQEYMINFIDDIRILGENVGECRVVTKYANKSGKTNAEVSCRAEHRFQCAQGENLNTVIRKSINSCSSPQSLPESESSPATSIGLLYDLIGVVTAVVIFIGLVIIGCLIRRWMSKMQTTILEALRQKYDHQMYQVERIEDNQEPEPATPISPGGSSLYENLDEGSHPPSRTSFNETFSYHTSHEIRRPVTVPITFSDSEQTTEPVPRLSIPSRTPSRENAVRQKIRPMKSLPNKPGWRKLNRLSTRCDEASGNDNEIELKSVAEETIMYKKELRSKVVSKPQPTPELNTLGSELRPKKRSLGMTIRDISGEFVMYLDQDSKTESCSDNDSEYEHIWEQKK